MVGAAIAGIATATYGSHLDCKVLIATTRASCMGIAKLVFPILLEKRSVCSKSVRVISSCILFFAWISLLTIVICFSRSYQITRVRPTKIYSSLQLLSKAVLQSCILGPLLFLPKRHVTNLITNGFDAIDFGFLSYFTVTFLRVALIHLWPIFAYRCRKQHVNLSHNAEQSHSSWRRRCQIT